MGQNNIFGFLSSFRRKPTGLSIAVAKHKRNDDPTERIFNVKNITIHEKYNRATQDRDIAMIE